MDKSGVIDEGKKAVMGMWSIPGSYRLFSVKCVWHIYLQRRIMVGSLVLSESSRSQFFDSAQRVRAHISSDFTNAFSSGVMPVFWPECMYIVYAIGHLYC